jgi:hypothetical protein
MFFNVADISVRTIQLNSSPGTITSPTDDGD